MEQRPASEWVRVPDAHEALIARQDFELVQRIKGLDTRTSPNEDTVYLFSGILICGCCGSRMTRKTNRANGKEYHYYYCPTGKKKGCAHPVMLKESSLIDCVRDSLKAYIGNIASLEALLTGIDQSSINQALAKEYSDHITDNERRLEQVLEFKARLYESLVGGMLTKEEYASYKAKYTKQAEDIRESVRVLKEKLTEVLENRSERNRWISQFTQFSTLETLDRRALIHMVQSIRVRGKRSWILPLPMRTNTKRRCSFWRWQRSRKITNRERWAEHGEKSRKETAAVAVQEADAPCRAAIYVRLSVEDTHTHSVSIETQQMIIARYLEQYPEISVYDTYIDNGATGTNFHRPGFQQMLSDIEAGHVNCVIVKDLSRLGRNTIDTGYYIEQYFRIRNIRFIAVNENFDTAAPEDAHSGIIIPLRNMINEAYALDIGRKIRAQQRQAMKDGKFIGARTPYGYLKAEGDCHQLIIDPVAAIVVQRMFRWASEGAGLNTIAVRLNEAGILTPSHYKKMQGKITHENLLGNGKWQTRTVGVILRSEVYTGDLVQGQTKTVDHRQVKADAEEWTVVRDTHEAIISREQFAAVQEILNQTASRAKAREVKAYTPNLLKGKVFCAHCGGSLHRQRNIRKKSDDVYFYHCLSQSRISKDACPGVTIREDALLDMLADMLQEALNTALGDYRLSLAELPRQAADRAELREKITSRKQEIQRFRGIVRSLYENLVQGVLTKDEYFDYKEKYESRITDLSVEMEQLEDGLRTMDAQAEQHRALEQDAAQIKTDRGLTGALIERLIDRIEVSHDKQITVRYRFQSEFETYAEVLEQCRNM